MLTQDIVIKNQMSIGFHSKPAYGFKRIRWLNKLKFNSISNQSEIDKFHPRHSYFFCLVQLCEATLIRLDQEWGKLEFLGDSGGLKKLYRNRNTFFYFISLTFGFLLLGTWGSGMSLWRFKTIKQLVHTQKSLPHRSLIILLVIVPQSTLHWWWLVKVHALGIKLCSPTLSLYRLRSTTGCWVEPLPLKLYRRESTLIWRVLRLTQKRGATASSRRLQKSRGLRRLCTPSSPRYPRLRLIGQAIESLLVFLPLTIHLRDLGIFKIPHLSLVSHPFRSKPYGIECQVFTLYRL